MTQPGPHGPRRFFAFGTFRLEPDRRRLWCDGKLVPLYPKAVEALTALVRHAGEILPRERLKEELWRDNIVEDSNLTVAISHLRKVLAENSGGTEEFIETIPRVGYRFIAPIQELIEPAAGASNGHRNGNHSAIEKMPLGRIAEPAAPVSAEQSSRIGRKAIWLSVLAASALAAGGFIAFQMLSERGTIDPASVTSVAVLPLKTLTGNANDDYLADGLTEGLIHSLSRLKGLKVISRGSVFAFENKEIAPQEAGRRLGVMAVIEGSVRRKENSTRVLLRLVSTKDGDVLWATETADQSASDPLQLEAGLARSVSLALQPQLSQASAGQFARGQTKIPAAYQAFLKGRYFWNKRTFSDMEKSIDYFNQAIAQDASYALAYAGLADAYALLNYYGATPPDETFPKARQAAQRALQLDDSLAEAHTSLAYVRRAYDWDWTGAEREFKRAIELNPNYATAHFWYGEHLSYVGRSEEGIAQIKRAAELDPLSLIISGALGWSYHMARQPDLAIAQLRKTLEMDPNYAMTHFYLGMAYEGKGMYHEAIAAYQKSQEISPLGPGMVGLGHAYAMSGRENEARRILDQIQERVEKKQARPTSPAIVAAALNDHDTAFAWLDRSYEQRAEGVVYLKAQPYLDSLRADPRRKAFLQRIGLAEE